MYDSNNEPLKAEPQPACKPKFESQASITRRSSIISSCRICLSSIFEAASLTCGHKFCEKCLSQYWRIRDKPDFIICPLCRACAFNISFAKKKHVSSTEDFRKTFNPVIVENVNILHNLTKMCLKMGILMPALYFIYKWLKQPFVDMITLMFQSELSEIQN